MYVSSNTPILEDARADFVRHAGESAARIAAMRYTAASGRARLFQTLMAPNQAVDAFGLGTALNVASMQQQSETARAGASLATQPDQAPMASIDAPEVVPLHQGASCSAYARRVPSSPSAVLPGPTLPGMPRRAPTIIDGLDGPMHFAGAPSTAPGSYGRGGLTGYSPAWSDATEYTTGDTGLKAWAMAHPWLVMALAGAGVMAWRASR